MKKTNECHFNTFLKVHENELKKIKYLGIQTEGAKAFFILKQQKICRLLSLVEGNS